MAEETQSWAERFGLPSTGDARAAWGSADFYARFAPSGDFDGTLLAVHWVYWGFAFDDAYCDTGPYSGDPAAFARLSVSVQRAVEVPHTPPPTDPFMAALHDIGTRMRKLASPGKNRRFHAAHQAWLCGVQWQIANQASGLVPSLDDYLLMRLHASGGEPTFALLEVANGLPDIPPDEVGGPAVRALTEMAIMVAALDNDRHSAAAEAARGHTGQNIFSVLANAPDVPAAEVSDLAVGLRDHILGMFLGLRDRVVANASPALRRYLADLGHGIRGNAEWGQRAARYLAAGDGESPAVANWADAPLDSAGRTLRPPAFSWWWNAFAPANAALGGGTCAR
jgi:terpene synthase-like protein